MKKSLFPAVAYSLLLISRSFAADSTSSWFSDWPAGASPREVGLRVAKHFLETPHPNSRNIIYPETITWYGALKFSKLIGDRELTGRLIDRFEPLFSTEAKLIPKPVNVDSTVFSAVPWELYLATGKSKYLDLAKDFADRQWKDDPARKNLPKDNQLVPVSPELSWQTRFWIDDMFMITLAQAQAYRGTGEKIYIDRAAREMAAYLDKLQQPNGLFFHAPDVPFYWGRGNGWVAAGMAELLSSLPAKNPDRPKILAGYHKMMAALLKTQDAHGMWNQLIDDPSTWPETSCTGMFTFAMITGVKNGWLDGKTYGPAARKGWLALAGYIDANANIHEVCEGTNKKNDRQYYLDRRRNVGDLHGQAPILWCATALLR